MNLIGRVAMSAIEDLMSAALTAPEARRAEALRVLRGEVAAAPSPRSEGPLLLAMGKAAQYMGVSRPTMWRMIRDGRLEKIEVLAGSFRMRRADLDRYVEEYGTGRTQGTLGDAGKNKNGDQAA